MRTLNNLKPHHRKSIEKLTAQLEKKANFQALILGGSITKGYERENSDIDIMIVIPDEEFQKRRRRKRLMYFDTSVCNYPDGYVDGKLVSIPFLKLVAEKGGEPARDAISRCHYCLFENSGSSSSPGQNSYLSKRTKIRKNSKIFHSIRIRKLGAN